MAKTDSDSGNWKFYQKPVKKRLNLLDRFVDRIRSTFQRFQNKPQQELQLAGRIQDLQKTADFILKQLNDIKEELRKEIDAETFGQIEEVVDPLIKEFSRLKKSVDQPLSVTQQAKTYQRYSQWIEKAKLWVQICSKANDKEAIIKAIINYTVDDFLEVIDRDIQVISDYQEHMLDALAVEEEEKMALAQRLELRLNSYLKGLTDLRVPPTDLPLHEIAIWKAQVDKRREKYFDAALHAIDKVINSTIPDTSGQEEHEHLVDVLSQIVYLENEAPILFDEIYTAKNLKGDQISGLEARLTSLEQEIHQLNLDLRLTPDLIDRLQTVSDMLEQARQRLIDYG